MSDEVLWSVMLPNGSSLEIQLCAVLEQCVRMAQSTVYPEAIESGGVARAVNWLQAKYGTVDEEGV